MSKNKKRVIVGADWQKRLNRLGRIFVASPLPQMLFVSTFILMRWWQNSDFQYIIEITAPLLLFWLISAGVFYLFRWILKNYLATHSASLLLVFFLYRYQRWADTTYGHWLANLLPAHWRTDFTKSLWLSALAFLVSLALGYLAGYLNGRFKAVRAVQPLKIILFVIIFVFASALVKSSVRLISIRAELAYRYPAPRLNKDPSAKVTQKPDIYYILPEDYVNAEVLSRVNKYDETPFLNYLSSQGFVNKQPVYANYPVTTSSLASTYAMNYLPEFEELFGKNNTWQTGFPYRTILSNPPIAQVLKQNGYSYDIVSSWWDFMRYRVKSDADPTKSYRLNVLGRHFFLSDLGRDIVNTSVLSPWLKKGFSPVINYDLDRNPQENLMAQVAAVKNFADQKSGQPKFVMAQLMIPHPPYIFLPDGSIANYDNERNDNDVDENVKYANQVAYTNKVLEDLISHIKKSSPNAIIILQSDEGSYPKDFRYKLTPNHYYNPIDLAIPQMRQKLGILASYYMPGASPADVAANINSPVNVFRYVLNHYLGYKMDYLPDCHFAAGDKYKIYNYELITDKLTGQPAPAGCKKYQ